MAENTQSRPVERPPEQRKGLIAFVLSLPFKILGLLLGSLILSFILEYIGLAFFWKEEGWHHSHRMFNNELAWLSDNFKASLIFQEPGKTIAWILGLVYEWCFVKSGFIAFTQSAEINSQGQSMLGYASRIYLWMQDYALASVYVVLTFVVRLMVLVLSIPLFILAVLIGATDGLVRRDLRRFGAGRESSFIYHRAKQLVIPLTVAPWVIYLAMPVTVHPVLVLIPCAVALGLAVLVTAATFKKYL
ncbi:MAG: TIGR03747 family integrating conjugative element membrane protein [Burkholderiales bacterium]|jgi:integrating conjugative element membrane protein (TIGR03747 family)|nr:TIGR03747 family integrating conjugative element membrane protein [Burkholderiales bacterium]